MLAFFLTNFFEAFNYLGRAWSKQFKDIFSTNCRLVVCLLDSYYENKIWPTFERECFLPRISEGEVIPIFLDSTVFVAEFHADIVGIKYPP